MNPTAAPLRAFVRLLRARHTPKRRNLAGGRALPASFFPAGGHGPQAAAFVFQRDGNSFHGFSG